MEKTSPSLLRQHNGVLRLPPGFRFHPTDEELVVQYLRRKVLSCPLPACIIPEIDLGKHDPWDLPGEHFSHFVQSKRKLKETKRIELGGCERERYFFALREAKYPNGSRSNRATGSGYWKATGKDRAIVASKCNQLVVGMKKSLVFYRGKAPSGSRTDWIMHEYRLASTNAAIVVAPRDWVLCRVFMKKRATKMDVDIKEHHEGRRASGFIDFMGQQGGDDRRRPSSPSASDSSCVTDESSNGEDTTATT